MLEYNLVRSHWIWLLLSTSKLKGTGTLHIKVDCNFSETIVTLTCTRSRTRKAVTFLCRTNGLSIVINSSGFTQLWRLNNYKSLTGLFSHCMGAKSERKGRLIVAERRKEESRRLGTLFVAFPPPRSEVRQYGSTASIKELERRRNWLFCFAEIQEDARPRL